jgi:hypothetical protein
MWHTFKIRAHYSRNAKTLHKEFYAPDLVAAFVLARSEWPGADAWESL